MSREFSPEYLDDIDWLDPNLEVSLRMTPEAFQHLPEVTAADYDHRKERYRVMGGSWEALSPGEAEVVIEAVIEIPDDRSYYEEGRSAIEGVNLPLVTSAIEAVRAADTRSATLELVGEMHTHPVLQSELEPHQRSWHPSQRLHPSQSDGDVDFIIEAYRTGQLDPRKPFLFGIGGLMEDQ